MDILKKNKDILDLFSIAILEENVELELIFGDSERNNPLDKSIFMRLLDKLKQEYYFLGESTNLDIKCKQDKGISPVRCTIKDIDSIKQYCVTNSLNDIDNIEFVKKTNYNKISNSKIKDTDYNLRMNLKIEENLNYKKEQILKYNGVHDTKQKHYRFKKRYSFETTDTLFRIDLTAVKSTSYDHKIKGYKLANTFKESNILNNPETYELEIEFIGHEDRIVTMYKPMRVETKGYSRILDYYNKLERDIKHPVKKSIEHIYDPLSIKHESVWKPGYEPGSEDFKFTESVIVDVPKQEGSLRDALLGKNVKITTEFKSDIEIDFSKQFIIIDFDDNHDGRGTHVRLQSNDSNPEKEELYEKLRKLFPDTSLDDMEKLVKIQPLKKTQYNAIMKKLKPMMDIDIWVPLYLIYSEYFDMDELILGVFTQEMSGGGKLPEWAKKKSKPKSSSSSSSSGYVPKSEKVSLPSFSNESDKSVDSLDKHKSNILAPLLTDILNNHIHKCYSIINNHSHLIALSEQNNILSKYCSLTKQRFNPSGDLKDQKIKLLGPQPITLNHQHLDYESPINIIHGYAVTEKADGYRAQLFITDNRGYLITTKSKQLIVIYSGMKFPDINGEWLFDGEYITKNKDKQDMKLYMIFDIYHNGQNPGSKPAFNHIWLSDDDRIMTRSKLLKDFELKMKSIVIEEDSIQIGVKHYEYGAQSKDTDNGLIFEKCRKILDSSESYEYRTDGLILMPIYTKVKGDKSGKDVVNIGGTWEYNFKWKPPEENTIDFKISFEKDPKMSKDKIYPVIKDIDGEKILYKYKKANLMVGYDQRKDDTLDYSMMILKNERKKFTKEIIFDPPDTSIMINATNLLLHNGKIVCEDESEIKDGDIVEMRYNPYGDNDMIWEPLRVRYDKSIPQFFTIANNVWETISKPVSENVIKGLEPHVYDKKEVVLDDLYYVGDVESESGALREYHNYIKSNLIRAVCESLGKNIQLLDTSIGRGGDINKYLDDDCRITFLMGMDIANVNEASKRMYLKSKKPISVFLQGDTSLNIKSNVCDMGNKHTKTMLDILYGTIKSVKSPYKKFYKEYKGLAKKGFDVISSQFSFHYYLESRESFDGYLKNIQENLNHGGYFIATFYNGQRLYELLNSVPGGRVEYINDLGEKIYSIQKDYNIPDFNYRSENDTNMFGNNINVFMDSIGQEIPEYLVNTDFVIEEMRKIGLELATPPVSEKYSKIIKSGQEGFDSILESLSNSPKYLDSQKKFYPNLQKIFKNDHLKLLSGLNDYLIFRKI